MSEKMSDRVLREQIAFLLRGGNAHLDFESAVAGFPAGLRGRKPPNVEYSAWQLLEHMRLAQWDILEFCRDPQHVSPEYPSGFWPTADAPPDDPAWEKSVDGLRADLEAMAELVLDPSTDLFTPVPHGEGQSVLHEALLVADHNAYHMGQMVFLRRVLNAWPATDK